MVGIIITSLVAVLIIVTLVWSIIDKEFWFGLLFSVLIGCIWLFLMMIFSGAVKSFSETSPNKRIDYSESTEFSKVTLTNGYYIFEFDNRDPVPYPEDNVRIAPPSDVASIREGIGYASWGYWLPFDDWESGRYVEYTPSNK